MAGVHAMLIGSGGGEATTTNPYKYWRLHSTAMASPTATLTLNEVEFRSAVGGPSVAVGGVATASTGVFSGSPGEVFDGDMGTACSWRDVATSSGVPSWIQYEMPYPVGLSEIAIAPNTVGQAPTGFRLEFSSDGTSWATAKTWSGVTGWVGRELKAFEL